MDVVSAPSQTRAAASAALVRGGALDSLRFLASFLIVLYHFGAESPIRLWLLHPVFARGYLATDFFLMLSGYVLGRAYGRGVGDGSVSGPQFLRRRLTRIWPGHLIMLAFFAVFVLLAEAVDLPSIHPEQYRWTAFLMQAPLVSAWGFDGGDGWNMPTWSLSALAVCYAVFPLLWRGQAKLRQAWLVLGLAVMLLIGADHLYRAVLERSLYDIPFHQGVLRAVPLFAVGMALARVTSTAPLGPKAAQWVGWSAGALFVGLQFLGRFDTASILSIAAIILACGSRPVKHPSATMEWGAKLSFSLFLTHALTGAILYGALHHLIMVVPIPLGVQWVMWATGFPLALAVAYAFDRYVDQPVQAWLQSQFRGRRAPRPEPAPSA